MKKKLAEHIRQVCLAALPGIEPMPIFVYGPSGNEEDFPVIFNRTHEFMVFLDFSGNVELLSDSQEKLEVFTGKRIRVQQADGCGWLSWGEGDSVAEPTITPLAKEQAEAAQLDKNISWLDSKTVLPAWLEREIFEVQHARYDPDWKKFEHNLDLTEDDLRVYLGTYFPRSYAEAFCVMDNLFSNDTYQQVWADKSTARILDIGCGSGGNLIGLLTVLEKYCPSLETIHITAIDGSQFALDVLKKILATYEIRTGKKIHSNLMHCKVNDVADFPDLDNTAFDFVSSFKMGCEIISKGAGNYDQAYYKLLEKYMPALSATGIFFLLDVTTKAAHADFYPRMMNQQACRFIQTYTDFSTLIPVPCHLNEHKCNGDCFTQKEFKVSHRKMGLDKSRVAYRLLGLKVFVESILKYPSKAEYVIFNKDDSSDWITCSFSVGNDTVKDAYKLDL